MKRRLPFFISAAILCVALVALVGKPARHSPVEIPTLPESIAAAIGSVFSPRPAPPESAPLRDAAQASTSLGAEAVGMRELRIAAIRNGVNYGWIQLPRGTRVELLRREGKDFIVRYGETVLRVHRDLVEAGLIVPKPRRELYATL